MRVNGVSFSIASDAAWAPGLSSAAGWAAWAAAPWPIEAGDEPQVARMPAMLRRRAGFLGKMALEVAYECLGERADVPTVFCSRHGEVSRAISLLSDLARGEPVSPTAFGLAVHNASAGLLSIARADRASHIALSAGAATVEYAVIEACGLLADGAPMVLLVAYDAPLPHMLAEFEDCAEQAHAWAWLMVPAAQDPIRLSWCADAGAGEAAGATRRDMPGSLEVLRFQRGGARSLQRHVDRRCWTWSRNA
jgi:hypothetical protein